MIFYCAEKSCSYRSRGPYRVSLPPEACVDEHNYADLFCPYCKSVLVRQAAWEHPETGKVSS